MKTKIVLAITVTVLVMSGCAKKKIPNSTYNGTNGNSGTTYGVNGSSVYGNGSGDGTTVYQNVDPYGNGSGNYGEYNQYGQNGQYSQNGQYEQNGQYGQNGQNG